MVIKRSLIIDSYSDICKDDPKLRPYQQKAKKEIFESWDEIDNVMFQMPTGTGKTRLFTSIIRDINDYSIKRREAVKILIIAHRTELIDQIDESLRKYQVVHNVIAGGRDRNYKYPVSVASIQTITHPNNLRDAKKLNVQFVIIDEAHHALAATYKKLWDMYPGSKKLGVTATPWRMNHQSFTDLFDKLVLSMPIKDFIKQGFLAPYKYFSLRSDCDILNTIDDIELDKFGEYKESSMEEKMDIGSIRAQLLESYLALAERKKGIIYAINIVHAKHICAEYKKAGYVAVSIDSKTPAAERKDLVDKFRKGEIDIIVNVDIFSEGFDCPDIEFIQLARPTRSLVKYLQQVGRGLRITGNKQECIILDNVGMYSRFGLPDARRHWRHHFLGHDVDEEEPKRGSSKGTGRTRYVDMSEGTEDMELIQDVYDEVEVIEKQPKSIVVSSSAINDFFPLWGITLGETTWKQVKDMGYKIEKWENDSARNIVVEDVAFWDHEGEGKFSSMYWVRDESDFPSSWKSKGFSWNLSFDKWWEVFKNLGYKLKVKKQPCRKEYSGREILFAEFVALSPDGSLLFDLEFNYGEDGYYTSSPRTLYSITVDYKGLPVTKKETAVSGEEKKEPHIDDEKEKKIKSFVVKEDDLKIEHVYIGIPSVDPYIETEVEQDKTEEKIDYSIIEKVFDRKATSYKFFWFLAILKIYQEKRNSKILFKDILIKMVSCAWKYVFMENSKFPKLDMLPVYLETIDRKIESNNSTKGIVIDIILLDYYDKWELNFLLSPLLKNVPYRFLSPWIEFTNNDEVAAKSNDSDMRCPYALHDDYITINPIWGNYFLKNYNQLTQFTEKELRKYLKLK